MSLGIALVPAQNKCGSRVTLCVQDFNLQFFLHCKYVAQLVTWELEEELRGVMGKVQHAPLVL